RAAAPGGAEGRAEVVRKAVEGGAVARRDGADRTAAEEVVRAAAAVAAAGTALAAGEELAGGAREAGAAAGRVRREVGGRAAHVPAERAEVRDGAAVS